VFFFFFFFLGINLRFLTSRQGYMRN